MFIDLAIKKNRNRGTLIKALHFLSDQYCPDNRITAGPIFNSFNGVGEDITTKGHFASDTWLFHCAGTSFIGGVAGWRVH